MKISNTKPIEFNYEQQTVENLTTSGLLHWVAGLHTALIDQGLIPGTLDTETDQQFSILARVAENQSRLEAS